MSTHTNEDIADFMERLRLNRYARSEFDIRVQNDPGFPSAYTDFITEGDASTRALLQEFCLNLTRKNGECASLGALRFLGMHRVIGQTFATLYKNLCKEDAQHTFLVLEQLDSGALTRDILDADIAAYSARQKTSRDYAKPPKPASKYPEKGARPLGHARGRSLKIEPHNG